MSQDKEREALIEQARKHVDLWDSPTPVHHTLWANEAADLLRELVAALASQPPAVQGEPLTELLIEVEFGQAAAVVRAALSHKEPQQ